jgi:hypothetical protein
MNLSLLKPFAALLLSCISGLPCLADDGLTVSWAKNFLTIRGPGAPEDGLVTNYLEAFCRPGSTDRDWHETVIPHKTELVSAAPDGKRLELVSTLDDGVRVDHVIQAGDDEVTFLVTAHNPTGRASDAHWAQPCTRVANFTGRDQETYLPKCFIFLDGKLARLPTRPWATKARYVPGQVYCPKDVDRNDVNPRPLSELVPSNGLVGCFSADERYVMAVAWRPYQELFQGVIVCIHSDFRIGGLAPGETKRIEGKLYLTKADIPALLARYELDFPDPATDR